MRIPRAISGFLGLVSIASGSALPVFALEVEAPDFHLGLVSANRAWVATLGDAGKTDSLTQTFALTAVEHAGGSPGPAPAQLAVPVALTGPASPGDTWLLMESDGYSAPVPFAIDDPAGQLPGLRAAIDARFTGLPEAEVAVREAESGHALAAASGLGWLRQSGQSFDTGRVRAVLARQSLSSGVRAGALNALRDRDAISDEETAALVSAEATPLSTQAVAYLADRRSEAGRRILAELIANPAADKRLRRMAVRAGAYHWGYPGDAALEDGDDVIREWAVRYISVGRGDLSKLEKRLAQDPSVMVRRLAARQLGDAPWPEAAGILRRHMWGQPYRAWRAVVAGLSFHDSAETTDQLQKAALSPVPPYMAADAVAALSRNRHRPAARKALQDIATQHSDAKVKELAGLGLQTDLAVLMGFDHFPVNNAPHAAPPAWSRSPLVNSAAPVLKPIPAPAITAPPPPTVAPTTVSAPTGSPTAFPALLADMTALQSQLARATSSTLGSEFIAVFNDHAAELTAIFNNDPSLGGRVANLVDALGELASRLVEGTLSEADFFLAKELQHQMDGLLRDLYAVASRPLGDDLHKACNAEKQALFDALRAAGMSDDGNFGKKGVK